MKQTKNGAIIGYFVAMSNEQFKQGESITTGPTGRGGVFFRKENLVSTVDENQLLDKRKLRIIEVSVPEEAVSTKDGCPKFGIKSGKDIPIVRIQSFAKAKDEVMVSIT